MSNSDTHLNNLSGLTYIKQNIESLLTYLQINTDGFINGFKLGTMYRKKAGLPASLSFIGSFVSNSLLSFLLVEFFLSVILAILFTPLFWSFVSLYMTMALIIMMIVKKPVIMILNKLCLSDKYVRVPRLFGYFKFNLLFTNIYAGFITAFMLFIVLLLAIIE